MLFPGQLGQGVSVDSYRRIRDVFNDVQLRAASSDAGVARRALPRAARDLAGDPGARPTTASSRSSDELLQRLARRRQRRRSRSPPASRWPRPAESLTTAFNHASTTLRDDARERQHRDRRRHHRGERDPLPDRVPEHADRPARARRRAGRPGDAADRVKPGQAPNDLLDRRDLLLDQLGKLANVTSVTYDDQQPRHRRRRGPDRRHARRPARPPITRAEIDAQFTSGASPAARCTRSRTRT